MVRFEPETLTETSDELASNVKSSPSTSEALSSIVIEFPSCIVRLGIAVITGLSLTGKISILNVLILQPKISYLSCSLMTRCFGRGTSRPYQKTRLCHPERSRRVSCTPFRDSSTPLRSVQNDNKGRFHVSILLFEDYLLNCVT